jgi:glycerol dehydrogenase
LARRQRYIQMIQTSVFPGKYLQGANAIAQLPSQVGRLGGSALLIADIVAMKKYIPQVEAAFKRAKLELIVEEFGGECCDNEIERLKKVAESRNCDVVIGMGGGKTMDTGKSVGHGLRRRVVMVPTIASTDAPTSSGAVVYTPEGAFSRYLFFERNPDLVLVDTAIIAQAPVRFLIAGIGDALSTWFEADACRQSYANNFAGGVGTLAAYSLARLCYDTILEFGLSACRSCEAGVVTPALEHVVEANTLLSGLGFESVGIASAHAIHNGLTVLQGTHSYYHGEKVAIGVEAGLFLGDRHQTLIDEVYAFCESVGLPTTLKQIGLADVTDEDLSKVAEAACAKGETIHNEPSPVSPGKVFASIKLADAFGQARLKQ